MSSDALTRSLLAYQMDNELQEPWAKLHQTDEAIRAQYRSVGLACGLVCVALGLTVIFGWILHIPLLVTGLPHLVPAHLLSAMSASVLAAAVLACYSGRGQGAISAVAVIIGVFSVLVLFGFASYLFPPFGVKSVNLPALADPNEMAPNSLICMLASSISLLIISTSTSNNRFRLSQLFAMVGGTVALLALIGYAYTVEPLYGIGHFRAMSLPGSVVYLLLAVSLFMMNPEYGLTRILVNRSSAGILSRRLYTAVLIALPLIGFVSLLGSTFWDQYDLPFALALLVVASMLIFSAVIALTSRTIERVDVSRLRAEEDVRRSRERLRELSQSIQTMQEEERIRIAREVHDELGQLLTAIKMDMALLKGSFAGTSEIKKRLESTVDLVNSTLKTVQRITSELRPSILDNLGLAAAIEWQAKEFESRSGIHCELNIPDEYLPVSSAIATAVFRIFQETITNVGRHAQATHVDITLEERHNSLILDVHDNGVGLTRDALERPQSFGIMGMRERAKLVEGSIAFESSPGEGTTVHVTIPLPESLEEESYEETVTDEE